MNYFFRFSLKFRLTLLFVLVFTAMMMAFSSILYSEFSRIQLEEFDTVLYNYAIDIAESLEVGKFGEIEFDSAFVKLNEKILPFALGAGHITLFDINQRILARSKNSKNLNELLLNKEILKLILKTGAKFENTSFGKILFREIYYVIPAPNLITPLILHISVPLTSYVKTKNNLLNFFGASLPIMMFISALIGYFFVGRVLRPMLEIINKTKEIEISNLQERVPYPYKINKNKDEIWLLAETINHLLGRLQESFENQERFIQDVSHQLKTPLAIIKGELENLQASIFNENDVNHYLESFSQEINHLVHLTSDLLILANIDNANTQLNFSSNRIDEILLLQISRLSSLALKKNIILEINFDNFFKLQDEQLYIYCDADLLGVLFYNLIENAIKYTRINSTIVITGLLENGFIEINFSDEGPGIPPEFLDKIFERFFRAQNVIRSESGSGLGLAICKVVADTLKGQLWALNNTGKNGTTFYFRVPLNTHF